MADFLLELRSEEIPARMQAKARNDLARLFAEAANEAGLSVGAVDTFSSPRRLALIARDVADATEASREELKGPRTSAPPQALEGFLRKTGLSQDQLEERDGVYFAAIERPGRAASEVIAETIERIVADFPWPKSMRWGAGSMRWVRPLHGIVALLGEEIVSVEIDGIASGATTVGHRFHHPGTITIGGAADYLEKLQACHVIVDQAERERIIREGAAEAAAKAGLTLLADEGLVVENAGLTEWPVPLAGSFDPEFLDVPREVIVLTMRTNQKYFACTYPPRNGEGDHPKDGGGADAPEPTPPSAADAPATSPFRGGLAPAFVCVANIDASDGGEAIAQGNARVLAARLSDARFFWEQDLKVPLEEQAQKLGGIVFHEKLGTVADKVERVAKLARWLVKEGVVRSSLPRSGGEGDHATHGGGAPPSAADASATSPSPLRDDREELADQVERAARLAKADLVTGMVGEFPELQGVIGGYLAEAQGEPKAVADAIRDHYKPVGQGDDVPTVPVTVAVALADKFDTLCSFFEIREYPTGSKDPFALRRAALGIITIIESAGLKVHVGELVRRGWLGLYDSKTLSDAEIDRLSVAEVVTEFIVDRLEVALKSVGIKPDLVRASKTWFTATDGRLDRISRRAFALYELVGTTVGSDLLAAYKRAANILKKEGWTGPQVMSSKEEQGIPQTGEEDPLVLVDDPIVGEAIAEMASGQAGADLPQEKALIAALDEAEPKAAAAVEAEDFTGAMAALATLRGPIDQFFDHVTVNDPDSAKRERRLNLLTRFRDAVNQVADFSKIEG